MQISAKALAQKYQDLCGSQKAFYENFQVREVLEAAIERKTKKNPSLNFQIMDSQNRFEELKIFISGLIACKNDPTAELPKRFQIIYGELHRSGLDFLVSKEGKVSLIYIDAAAADANWGDISAIGALFESDLELTRCLGGLSQHSRIQTDTKNCAYFALEQLYQASKIDFHGESQRVRTQSCFGFDVEPLNLPPTLVRCAQSKTFLSEYFAKDPSHLKTPVNKKGQTLEEFVVSHTREGITNRGELKPLNYAAEDKIDSLRKKLGINVETVPQARVIDDEQPISIRPRPAAFILGPLPKKKTPRISRG